MNCPKCGSPDVTVSGDTILCQQCQSSPASPEDMPKPPADPYAPRLVRCPACSHQVSSQAASCPSCGQPLAPQVDQEKVQAEQTKVRNKIRSGCALLVLAVFILFLWMLYLAWH